MLDFLLKHKANLEYKGARAAGALAEVSAKGDLKLLERLLKAGASPNARGLTGKPLLIEAVKEQNHDKFDLLLAAKANVNAVTAETTGREMSALTFAVANGNESMQDALIAAGANPDVYSTSGDPLIFDAVSRMDEETARRLLAGGAKPDVATDDGVTPLGIAALNDHLDMVDLLLEYDADPSFAPEGAAVPLLGAVESGNVAIGKSVDSRRSRAR